MLRGSKADDHHHYSHDYHDPVTKLPLLTILYIVTKYEVAMIYRFF